MVERQLAYNVVTKEYKVAALKGETREPLLTQRPARRPAGDVRAARAKLAPAARSTQPSSIYVRVHAESALNGENSIVARMAGTRRADDAAVRLPHAAAGAVAMPLLSDQNRRKRNLAHHRRLPAAASAVATAVRPGHLRARAAGRLQHRHLRPVQPEPDRLPAADRAALPQPGEAVVRAPAERHRRPLPGQAGAGLPGAGGGAGRPDLRHRLELHQQVDRGLVQAAGGAPARSGTGGRADVLRQPRAHRPPPRPHMAG